jgi:hypothetical protein
MYQQKCVLTLKNDIGNKKLSYKDTYEDPEEAK